MMREHVMKRRTTSKLYLARGRLARRGALAARAIPLFAGTLLVCLAACGAPPVTQYYDIQPFPERPAGADEPQGAMRMHLLEVRVPAHLDDPRIFYRSSRYEAGRYEYHRWIRPLSEALAEAFLGYLRASNRFDRLAGPLDPRRGEMPEAVLVVEECNEVDRIEADGSRWVARISMRLILTEPGSSNPVERVFHEEIPVGERNASGVVAAINDGLARIFPRLAEQIIAFSDDR
jgi:uncharacterized lipoprotein YmbA